jgi:pimeloyl-ACP methyl ester carboxylesterase
VALRCAPEREAWAYEGAAALDLWTWAERVRAPVALLLAEHSAVPARLADRLAAVLPRCDALRIPGATHFAALERPAEVGSALRAFAAVLAP